MATAVSCSLVLSSPCCPKPSHCSFSSHAVERGWTIPFPCQTNDRPKLCALATTLGEGAKAKAVCGKTKGISTLLCMAGTPQKTMATKSSRTSLPATHSSAAPKLAQEQTAPPTTWIWAAYAGSMLAHSPRKWWQGSGYFCLNYSQFNTVIWKKSGGGGKKKRKRNTKTPVRLQSVACSPTICASGRSHPAPTHPSAPWSVTQLYSKRKSTEWASGQTQSLQQAHMALQNLQTPSHQPSHDSHSRATHCWLSGQHHHATGPQSSSTLCSAPRQLQGCLAPVPSCSQLLICCVTPCKPLRFATALLLPHPLIFWIKTANSRKQWFTSASALSYQFNKSLLIA